MFQVPIPDENTIVQNATHHVNGTYAGLASIATTLNANLFEDYGKDYSAGGREVTFAVVFGVLFSGVTGKCRREMGLNDTDTKLARISLNRHYGWSEYVRRTEKSGSQHSEGDIIGCCVHIHLLRASVVLHQCDDIEILAAEQQFIFDAGQPLPTVSVYWRDFHRSPIIF